MLHQCHESEQSITTTVTVFYIVLLWSCFPFFPALVLFGGIPESQEHVGTKREALKPNNSQRQLEPNPFDQPPDQGQLFLSFDTGSILVPALPQPTTQAHNAPTRTIKSKIYQNPFKTRPDTNQSKIDTYVSGTEHEQQKHQQSVEGKLKSQLQDRIQYSVVPTITCQHVFFSTGRNSIFLQKVMAWAMGFPNSVS